MSRYDGWLVRYIMTQGTPAALSVKEAAKGACIRPEAFLKALRNAGEVRQDAKGWGFDPEALRWDRQWQEWMEAEQSEEESKVASGASTREHCGEGIRRIPASHKYRGSNTQLGVTCPHPGGSRSHCDNLNVPINPIHHPEPQGEWHDGLNTAGKREWRRR